METIGDRIRKEREAQGVSRGDLASSAGIAKTTLADLEYGQSKSTTKLHKIAAHLGVRVEWLETGRGQKVQGVGRVSESAASYGTDASPAPQASESLRLDPLRLEAAVRFLEQQFALWGREFDAAARAPLIAGVYEYLSSETPKNLVSMSQWLASRLGEEDSDGTGQAVAADGIDRKRNTGGAR